MTAEYARDLWQRAENALKSAEALLTISGDDAASRAYYAAFDAVSAAFVLQGKTFTKHSAVRASVHRDWVQMGLWPKDLGKSFDSLWELRDLGDYGGDEHVEEEDAIKAVEAAKRILESIRTMCPDLMKG